MYFSASPFYLDKSEFPIIPILFSRQASIYSFANSSVMFYSTIQDVSYLHVGLFARLTKVGDSANLSWRFG